MSQETPNKDNWIQKHWRPILAITYVFIIVFDFMIAPIFWSVIQVDNDITIESIKQWTPLTLQSGGLFHISMGTILGVAAFTRGQEKVQRLRSGYSDFYGSAMNPYDNFSDRYNMNFDNDFGNRQFFDTQNSNINQDWIKDGIR